MVTSLVVATAVVGVVVALKVPTTIIQEVLAAFVQVTLALVMMDEVTKSASATPIDAMSKLLRIVYPVLIAVMLFPPPFCPTVNARSLAFVVVNRPEGNDFDTVEVPLVEVASSGLVVATPVYVAAVISRKFLELAKLQRMTSDAFVPLDMA